MNNSIVTAATARSLRPGARPWRASGARGAAALYVPPVGDAGAALAAVVGQQPAKRFPMASAHIDGWPLGPLDRASG